MRIECDGAALIAGETVWCKHARTNWNEHANKEQTYTPSLSVQRGYLRVADTEPIAGLPTDAKTVAARLLVCPELYRVTFNFLEAGFSVFAMSANSFWRDVLCLLSFFTTYFYYNNHKFQITGNMTNVSKSSRLGWAVVFHSQFGGSLRASRHSVQ